MVLSHLNKRLSESLTVALDPNTKQYSDPTYLCDSATSILQGLTINGRSTTPLTHTHIRRVFLCNNFWPSVLPLNFFVGYPQEGDSKERQSGDLTILLS